MPISTEIQLRLPNSPGALAELLELLSAERITVVALSLEPAGNLRLVTDNLNRTTGVLAGARHRVSTRDVIVVFGPDASQVARLVAASGANLEYAYRGVTAEGAPVVVLGVDDAARTASRAGV